MSSFHSRSSISSTNTGPLIIMSDQQRARLKKFIDTTCADCDDKRPMWASLIRTPTGAPTNTAPRAVAAFLCYHCAGHHRSLGTHVCRVKSCSLDECKFLLNGDVLEL
jgi:uncharacterized membrane protein